MLTEQTVKVVREYTTTDLCLAVILKINGFQLTKIEPFNKNKFIFHFEQKDGINKVVEEYFLLSIADHPYKRFYSEMREIKNMIYNFPRQ